MRYMVHYCSYVASDFRSRGFLDRYDDSGIYINYFENFRAAVWSVGRALIADWRLYTEELPYLVREIVFWYMERSTLLSKHTSVATYVYVTSQNFGHLSCV